MAAKLVCPPVPKHFNTSGPCLPDLHVMLPPVPRLSEAQAPVDRGRRAHAPPRPTTNKA